MVKKSFLQSIWNVIVGSTNEKSHHRISAAQAEVLQRQYLDNQKKSLQIGEYPPYIDVAKRLFFWKNRSFQSCCFYLRRIADNEGKYAEPIAKIMQQYSQTAKRNAEDMAFLASQLKEIEKNIHFTL